MTIFIAIFTIGVLIILHELGHFFAAKKFGVKVEEFGMGLPPRLLGKKYGETLYSINALPLGGFVRMEGEEKRSEGPRSFNKKPLGQRLLIVAAGVLMFWLIAAFLFAGLGATSGIPSAIADEQENVLNPQVRVIGVAPGSPAAQAGLQPADTILAVAGESITKVGQLQELSLRHAGKQTNFEIQRGSEVLQVQLAPREDPPGGEGPMGIALTRTGLVKYAWYEAPYQGVARTAQTTLAIFEMLGVLISQLISGAGLPPGAQVLGPVGVVDLLGNSFALGIPSFLSFVATISIYLAIFNTIPIPALDGGRMFFLLLEGIRRKPLPEKIEQRAILISFLILIPLILWVTIGDIRRLF